METVQPPVPVDQLDAANPRGVRHMSANVREKTMSCWSERHLGLATTSAYLAHAQAKPTCRRVAKGGAYNAGTDYARPATRGDSAETFRSRYAGFRLVREME